MVNGTPYPILVIKHGALGDIVLATAGFKAIRERHPNAHIVCLTTKPYAELLAQSPYFNEIWVDSKPKLFNRTGLKKLRAMLNSYQWKWVYDLQTSKRTTRYEWLLKRPWPKISNVSRFASHGYTDPARHTKHALDNLKIQLDIAGISNIGGPDISWLSADISNLPLPQYAEGWREPTREARGSGSGGETPPAAQPPFKFALLVPGGAAHRPEKRWPHEQYASLAQELVGKKITPILIGTNAEADALSAIVGRVPQAVNLCGKTSIAQLAELARNAAMAVGNDTGPMHIIAASNCPSLVLFSEASNPTRSAPKGERVTIIQVKNLVDLSVDRVLASLTATA